MEKLEENFIHELATQFTNEQYTPSKFIELFNDNLNTIKANVYLCEHVRCLCNDSSFQEIKDLVMQLSPTPELASSVKYQIEQ